MERSRRMLEMRRESEALQLAVTHLECECDQARHLAMRRKIEALELEVTHLKYDRDRARHLALVADRALPYWQRLPPSMKWDKAAVLAVLLGSAGTGTPGAPLPPDLLEPAWADPDSPIPTELRNDRDVFRARIQQPGFAAHHRSMASRASSDDGSNNKKKANKRTCSAKSKKDNEDDDEQEEEEAAVAPARAAFPDHFLADKVVLLELVAACPGALRMLRPGTDPAHRALLDDRDVMEAVLDRRRTVRDPARPVPCGGDADDLCPLLGTFSLRLLADHCLMVSVIDRLARRPRSCTDRVVDRLAVAKSLLFSKEFCLEAARVVWTASLEFPDGEEEEAPSSLSPPPAHPASGDRAGDGACRRTWTAPECRLSCALRFSGLPRHLRSDGEVALAFCRLKGRNVAHCARLLDECDPATREAIFRAACDEDPFSAVYVPAWSPARWKLLSTKEGLLRSFKTMEDDVACEDENVLKFFNLVGSRWKNDRDVAVAASSASRAVLDAIRSQWVNDREFWSRLARHWSCVPAQWRADREFARLFAQKSIFPSPPSSSTRPCSRTGPYSSS
jgi:hypothetical protein